MMLLLDTHVAIWVAEGEPIGNDALRQIAEAIPGRGVLVSAVTAWEIALLHAGRKRSFEPSPMAWLSDLERQQGIRFIPLDHAMAAHSQALPGDFHRDPADRFLVATARVLDVPIVTRDKRILAYAEFGHVRAIAC